MHAGCLTSHLCPHRDRAADDIWHSCLAFPCQRGSWADCMQANMRNNQKGGIMIFVCIIHDFLFALGPVAFLA